MLAKLITYEKNDNIALGISAPWGSGKTSMLNLIKEQIKELKIDPKPIIVEFDPWFYGSEDKVIHSFFETLAKAIFKENHPAREKASKLIKSISEILTATPLNAASELANHLGNAIGPGALNSFDDVKKALIESLKEIRKDNSYFIVVVDDLDRLQIEEILTMLKLIRLVTDLPCIRTIVAFDEEATGQLISKQGGFDGINFVRKMINLPTYLPMITKKSMSDFITESIREVVGDEKIDRNSREKILEALPLINSVRLAKSIINMFGVGISCLKNQVDMADYFKLCAIFNIIPTLFHRLKNVEPPFEFFNNRVEMIDYSLKMDEFMGLYKIYEPYFAKSIHDYLYSTFQNKKSALQDTSSNIDKKSIIWYGNWDKYFSYMPTNENILSTSISIVNTGAVGRGSGVSCSSGKFTVFDERNIHIPPCK